MAPEGILMNKTDVGRVDIYWTQLMAVISVLQHVNKCNSIFGISYAYSKQNKTITPSFITILISLPSSRIRFVSSSSYLTHLFENSIKKPPSTIHLVLLSQGLSMNLTRDLECDITPFQLIQSKFFMYSVVQMQWTL